MSNVFYVSRLKEGFELSDLEALFTTVGDVRAFRAETSNMNTQLGVFEMETPQQAIDCVARFNGQTEQGQFLSLSSNKPVIHAKPVARSKAR